MRGTVAVVFVSASALIGASGVVAVTLGRSLVGCYTDLVPMGRFHLCGSGFWGAEWVPFALMAASLLVLAASLVVATVVLRRQVMGANRWIRLIEDRARPVPQELARTAQHVGLRRVAYVDMEEPLAVTVGLMRPRVLVSRGLVEQLGPAEVRAVLTHEWAHVRGRHPALYGATRAAAAALFAIPGLRALADRVVLHAEMAADRVAVGLLGVRPLVGALSQITHHPTGVDTSLAVGSIDSMLNARLRALAGEEPFGESTALPRLLISLFAGVALSVPVVLVGLAHLYLKGVL